MSSADHPCPGTMVERYVPCVLEEAHSGLHEPPATWGRPTAWTAAHGRRTVLEPSDHVVLRATQPDLAWQPLYGPEEMDHWAHDAVHAVVHSLDDEALVRRVTRVLVAYGLAGRPSVDDVREVLAELKHQLTHRHD